jgi:hypothetical protein
MESLRTCRARRAGRLFSIGMGGRRNGLVVAAMAGSGLAACLFPDLDRFEGTQPEPRQVGASPTPDAAPSGSATPGQSVKCGATDSCPVPEQYCCDAPTGPNCGPPSGATSPVVCTGASFGFAHAFLCDGEEDCPAGQTCCYEESPDSNGVNAKCTAAAACTGKTLCNSVTQRCPPGTGCTGSVASGDFKACQ